MRQILSGLFIIILLFIFTSFASAAEGKVVAYYFHGNVRCVSCKKIEQLTQNVITNIFSKDLAAGRLYFEPVNVDEKSNKHFIQDYQLYTKSVVLSLIKDGKEVKHKNLDKVWQLLRNEENFYQYIEDETQLFLNELEGSK